MSISIYREISLSHASSNCTLLLCVIPNTVHFLGVCMSKTTVTSGPWLALLLWPQQRQKKCIYLYSGRSGFLQGITEDADGTVGNLVSSLPWYICAIKAFSLQGYLLHSFHQQYNSLHFNRNQQISNLSLIFHTKPKHPWLKRSMLQLLHIRVSFNDISAFGIYEGIKKKRNNINPSFFYKCVSLLSFDLNYKRNESEIMFGTQDKTPPWQTNQYMIYFILSAFFPSVQGYTATKDLVRHPIYCFTK